MSEDSGEEDSTTIPSVAVDLTTTLMAGTKAGDSISITTQYNTIETSALENELRRFGIIKSDDSWGIFDL